jgi:hypothetical protein
MTDEVETRIDAAVAKRRAELEVMPIHEVRQEFQFTFQIYPDSHADKGNLIDRILVKIRAELERHS